MTAAIVWALVAGVATAPADEFDREERSVIEAAWTVVGSGGLWVI
jgi:hypothetical protein